MDKLKAHIEKHKKKWLNILNSNYLTDGGASIEEFARGRLTAYTELLNYIKKEEEENERTTKEKSRPGKQVQ